MKPVAEKPAFVVHKDDAPQLPFKPMSAAETVLITLVTLALAIAVGLLMGLVLASALAGGG